METRLASLQDAPFLAILHGESFKEGSWNLAQIAESLSLETTWAWLAQENGESRGFIIIQLVGHEAEILTFCVAPQLRRKGIGNILLRAMLTEMSKRKVQKLFLEVAEDNEAALALYQKTGFHIAGKRRGYYQRSSHAVDALTLELVL